MSSAARAPRAEANELTVADHVAALLEHPDTPADIFNAVADAVNELTGRFTLAREVLRITLPLALSASRGTAAAAEAQAVVAGEAQAVQPGACSCRGQGGSDGLTYAGITLDRARELADFLTFFDDDDERAHALMTLLRGIGHAAYHGDKSDVESLIVYAERAAYTNTAHSDAALLRFVALPAETLGAAVKGETVRQEEK